MAILTRDKLCHEHLVVQFVSDVLLHLLVLCVVIVGLIQFSVLCNLAHCFDMLRKTLSFAML